MACNESSDQDSGVLTEDTKYGSTTWTDEDSTADCYYDSSYTSTWEWAHSITAEDDAYGHDGINNQKYWYLHTWFTNTPENLIKYDCDYGAQESYQCNPDGICRGPAPEAVEYEIRHGLDKDDTGYVNEGDFDFEDPDPDDTDGSDGDGIADQILDVAMAVVGGASGSVLVSAGATAVAQFVDLNSSSPVTQTQGYVNDTRRQRWTWDIKVDGSDYEQSFPESACDTACARFQINNDMPYGEVGEVRTWSRWTFDLLKYNYDQCRCGYSSSYLYTTDWLYEHASFTSR